MSNRKTDWNPGLQRDRDHDALAEWCEQLLKMHDEASGPIGNSAWEILRERLDIYNRWRSR